MIVSVFFQVLELFKSYFSYKTIVNMDIRNTKATFADVTICKQYKIESLHNTSLSFENYIKKIDNILKNYPKTESKFILKKLRNKFGYYETIAHEIINDVKGPFVVDCRWAKWIKNGGTKALFRQNRKDSYVCNLATEVHRFQLPDLSDCYTFRALVKYKASEEWWKHDNAIRGLSVILYLGYDSSDYTNFNMNELDYRQSSGRGYKVEIHARKTFPMMPYALKFPPGVETSVRIKPFATTLLGPPYRDCTNQEYVDFNGSDTDFYVYSRHFCRSLCIQESFVRKCGCISVDIHASESLYKNYPYCGMINDDFNVTLQSLHCLEKTNTTAFCKALCRPPCQRLSYSLEIGSETWPHENFLSDFYSKYVNGTTYENNFVKVKEVIERINQLKTNSVEYEQLYADILKASNLISRNFAQLNVFFKDNEIHIYKDVEAMSVPTLISNLGGTFNLWIGITFFTFIELVEVVFRLCCVTENKAKTINIHEQSP